MCYLYPIRLWPSVWFHHPEALSRWRAGSNQPTSGRLRAIKAEFGRQSGHNYCSRLPLGAPVCLAWLSEQLCRDSDPGHEVAHRRPLAAGSVGPPRRFDSSGQRRRPCWVGLRLYPTQKTASLMLYLAVLLHESRFRCAITLLTHFTICPWNVSAIKLS